MTSVLESPLPRGVEWREWRVVEDGSTDGTRDLVRAWASRHPSINVRLISESTALGKIAAVRRAQDQLLSEGHLDDIIVFLDADATLDSGAMTALLDEFDDPSISAVTGLTIPSRRRLGCRASAFQIALAGNYAVELGPDALRLEGQFYAYRLMAFKEFRLQTGLIIEEGQMIDYIRNHNLKVRSAFGAKVGRTPPRGYIDFYRQTYRAFRASQLAGEKFPTAITELNRRAIKALISTTRQDPIGAVSYILARAICLVLNRVRPMKLTDTFPRSESTKE